MDRVQITEEPKQTKTSEVLFLGQAYSLGSLPLREGLACILGLLAKDAEQCPQIAHYLAMEGPKLWPKTSHNLRHLVSNLLDSQKMHLDIKYAWGRHKFFSHVSKPANKRFFAHFSFTYILHFPFKQWGDKPWIWVDGWLWNEEISSLFTADSILLVRLLPTYLDLKMGFKLKSNRILWQKPTGILA